MKSFRSIRLGAMATALAMALPASYTMAAVTLAAPKVSLGTVQAHASYDRFIVTYRTGSTERSNRAAALQNLNVAVARANMNRATVSGSGEAVAALTIGYQRKLGTGADLVRASRKLSQGESTALMQQIAADPAVAHVEVDAMMHAVRDIKAPANATPKALLTGAPNDPSYAQYQWHFNNPTGGADVANAWTLADGSGIVVAVIDTGITQHPDLDESLADAGYDFISAAYVSGRATDGRVPGGWDQGDWTNQPPYSTDAGCTNQPESSSWHGTHVSGTIAELTDNGVGMAGIAHNARVLPVRALGHCGGYTSDIADAIVWASGGHVDGVPDNNNPAQVINMSLGGTGACSADDVTGTAIAGAISRGVTVVVAAGNSSDDVVNYTPASCPGVISVGSNGITGKRAFYSNYGLGVTISAPGGGIYPNDASYGTPTNDGFVWSTVNGSATTPGNATYGAMAGTSQASPHVAGTVALVLGAELQAGLPLSTPAQIRNLLASTARPFPVKVDHPIGIGIVDAGAAVAWALSNNGSGELATPLGASTPLTGQAGVIGGSQLYSLNVPAGAKNLSLRSYGGTGDVSLFVKAGSAPSEDGSNADFRSTRPGNTETVVIAAPQTTTYYIRVSGVTTYGNLTLLGAYGK